jgi:hypothetical protein
MHCLTVHARTDSVIDTGSQRAAGNVTPLRQVLMGCLMHNSHKRLPRMMQGRCHRRQPHLIITKLEQDNHLYLHGLQRATRHHSSTARAFTTAGSVRAALGAHHPCPHTPAHIRTRNMERQRGPKASLSKARLAASKSRLTVVAAGPTWHDRMQHSLPTLQEQDRRAGRSRLVLAVSLVS